MRLKVSGFLKFIRRILVNKYTFVLLFFFIYLIFFDDHNLIKRYRSAQEIIKLEQEYQDYLKEIERNKAQIHQLKHDTVYLEKFAREHYFMKRDDEEIFILK
ncbi:MAG: Septum formation initiator [Bacteroidetes bacterium ADurb.Bin174]|nr:MAG: Septum formation initiator [Bacteroidetes bacterium ADurb.Bin174]